MILHQIRTGGYDVLNPFGTDYYVISFQVFVGNVTRQLQPLLRPNSSQPMVAIYIASMQNVAKQR